MWTEGAHIVFLLLIAVIFHKVIQSTLLYGKRLRRLRQTCTTAFEELNAKRTPENDEFIVLVREKEGKNMVYRNNCETNEKELKRIMNDPQLKDEVVSFKHIPDAENMSHIIGVYKDSDAIYECMACMHT
tara:strand:+ start:180 stop:569 length:390 start_codon:yes stop_codon:yes gene_type:complete